MIENQVLWLCARKDFRSTYQDDTVRIIKQGDINWDKFYNTALQHKVAPTIVANLLKLKNQGITLPKNLIEKHRINVAFQLAYRNNLMQDIERILEYFAIKKVDVLLAKGAALNLTVYDNSMQYIPGDLDIMLRNKRANISNKEDQADITFFKSLNYYPEWERFEHHDLSINHILPIDFHKIWQNAIPIKVGKQGARAFIMCPEDMLLFACINACRKRYFRLKSVCDIAEIIDFYPSLNWKKLVQDAQTYQCQTIVYTALLVTQLTVGCNFPETIFRDLGINPAKAFVIRKLANFLIEQVPLSELLPSKEIKWGKVNSALLLVTFTYDWPQFWQRLNYVWQKLNQTVANSVSLQAFRS